MIGAQLRGQGALRKALEDLGHRLAVQALPTALYREGHRIQAVAVPLAPVKDSHLRRSAYTAPPERKGKAGVSVRVGFGMIYAARQHFKLTWRHPRGGQALYLYTALQRRRPLMAQAMAADIMRAIASRSTAAPIGAQPVRPPTVGGKSLQAHNQALYAKLHPKRRRTGAPGRRLR